MYQVKHYSLNGSAHLVHDCSECRNYQFLPSLFQKCCPHSAMCSFSQKNLPWHPKKTRALDYHLKSESSEASRHPSSAEHLELCHHLCTSMVSFAESALWRASSHSRLSLLPEGKLWWDLCTFLGLRGIHEFHLFLGTHISPLQVFGLVYVNKQSNSNCVWSEEAWS